MIRRIARLGALPLAVAVMIGLPVRGAPLAAQGVVPKDSEAEWLLRVYRPDGTIQCGSTQPIPLDRPAKELANGKVRILSQVRRPLPMAVAAQCGMPTGQANVYLIAVTDPSKLDLDPASPKGFHRWPEEDSVAVVSIANGRVMCEGSPRSLDATAQTLRSAGVGVLDQAEIRRPAERYVDCREPQIEHVFWIPVTELATVRQALFVEHPSRLPAECAGVTVPADTMAQPRPQPAKALMFRRSPSKVYPFPDSVPVRTTYSVSMFGLVDSISVEPALSGRDLENYTNAAKQELFLPAVHRGCVVPWRLAITVKRTRSTARTTLPVRIRGG